MEDAINALSTAASLCFEASSTPEDNQQELTPEDKRDSEDGDEAKAGETTSKYAGDAELDSLN